MKKETFSYDTLPYPSKFFLQMHPDRLATHASLFGMTPPDVETCRVLELGCGNGSSLIAQASTLPNATFVGVDLAETHIADAKQMAGELGLGNVEFHQMDVADMTKERFGTFDFIVAHGLFSWIPEFVRTRVLEICEEMLSENGVGYMSYATYPGAFQRRMAREIMRRHSRDIDVPEEKVTKALSFLKFVADNAVERTSFAPALKKELERHGEHALADIYHDDLSDVNQPFYFEEFAAMLDDHGLQYLAEAELHAMGTQGLSQDAASFIGSIADIIEREQNLDFLRGRVFRQTLFCRAGIELDHHPKPETIKKFRLLSAARPVGAQPRISTVAREKFVDPKGMSIEIEHPLTKAALVVLGDSWGRAIPFKELIETAAAKFGLKPSEKDLEIASTILLQICRLTSLVELKVFQPEISQELPEKPRVSNLVTLQLRNGNNVLTRLNLDMKIEDDISRELIRQCDGTRSATEIAESMRNFVRANVDVKERGKLPDDIGKWARESLVQLAKLGIFEAT